MSRQQTTNTPLPSGSQPPLVFDTSRPTVSFADLARQGQDVMGSTLQQYGPPMQHVNHPIVHQQPNHAFYPLHQHPIAPASQAQNHPIPQKVYQHQANPPLYLRPHHQTLGFQQQQPPQLQPQPQQQRPQTDANHPLLQQRVQFQPQRQDQVSSFMSTPAASLVSPTPIYHIQPTMNPTHVTLSRPNSAGPTVTQSSTNRAVPSMPINNGPTSSFISSAPSTSSPPLDSVIRTESIPNETASNIISSNVVCLPSSSTPTMDIDQPPLEKRDILKVVRERCESLSLNELIEEYNQVREDMAQAQKNRDTAEKNLNEFVRGAFGKNVEHQPKFRRLKEEKSLHDDECKQFAEALKLISERLHKRFDYRIIQTDRIIQPLQKGRPPRQTARMNTTPAPVRRPSSPSRDAKKTMLDLSDDNLWCRDCDVHYPNLKEFCEHLHKRDHLTRCRKLLNPPWRTSLEQLSRAKTYQTYKSICAKLAGKNKKDFALKELDEAMLPALRGQLVQLKELALKRERGDFLSNDSLFCFKGYDFIIPINGYYCKLCDKTLRDYIEIEQHLKSYEHNYEHARSVALNASHERKFRQDLEKSYKEQHGRALKSTSKELSPQKNKAPTVAKVTKTSATTSEPNTSKALQNGRDQISATAKTATVPSQWSARLPYKKPTSRIVDEHEVIADKFDHRDTVKAVEVPKYREEIEPGEYHKAREEKSTLTSRPKQDSKTISGSKEAEKSSRYTRLKESLISEKSARTREEIDTKDADPIESSMSTEPLGGTEMTGVPFPELELSISGNVHHNALRDPRLAMPINVKLNRIDLKDYKHMLLDELTLSSRVDHMMTKKEPEEYKRDIAAVTSAAPTYFTSNGVPIPVSAEFDSGSSDSEKPFEMGMLENFFCDK